MRFRSDENEFIYCGFFYIFYEKDEGDIAAVGFYAEIVD